MDQQLLLPIESIELTENTEENFEKFHEANPHIYEILVNMTRRLVGAGRRVVGIKALFEIIRWNYSIQTEHQDFKINNNYAPLYARMIMENNPDLDGVFKTRRLKSEEAA